VLIVLVISDVVKRGDMVKSWVSYTFSTYD